MAHRHPRGVIPPGGLQIMVGQEVEDGRREGDVTPGPNQKGDPGEDQPQPQPIPQILPLCLLGLVTSRKTKSQRKPKIISVIIILFKLI